jgi:hypothetical protein
MVTPNQIDSLWNLSNLIVGFSFEFYEFSPLPAYQILDHSSEVGLPFLRPELRLLSVFCYSESWSFLHVSFLVYFKWINTFCIHQIKFSSGMDRTLKCRSATTMSSARVTASY